MIKRAVTVIILLFLLCACSQQHPDSSAATDVPTAPAATASASVAIVPPTDVPTEPPHSGLYIPGTDVEDVILCFSEVCLDAEITNSGDPCVLQKWISPVCYYLYGAPTREDLAILDEFVRWLNTVEGFPGIYEASAPEEANLRIHFCGQEEMLSLMGPDFHGMDGAVTFWYMDDFIYDAIICCRTDLTQHLRNSVILEELYNGLGPIQDTSLRTDSIIYSGFSEPQALTDMDQLILRLLYHPKLKCGMDAQACEQAIRELYY